jgi:2-oxoglutarate dehydrogenase E2 component (dihydrolipoamide succinyltransferase)
MNLIKEIRAPNASESVNELIVSNISKKPGDIITDKDTIMELESDKINSLITSESSGVIKQILVKDGETILPGDLLVLYEEKEINSIQANKSIEKPVLNSSNEVKKNDEMRFSKAASHILNNTGDTSDLNIKSSGGKDSNIVTKLDIHNALAEKNNSNSISQIQKEDSKSENNNTEVIKMSPLRKTIARRLKEAQNTAAILTTFNEIDMSASMELRKKFQEIFQKKYGIKLGFMSIFARASVLALQEIPAVNAEISNENIIYKNFYNIGIAVGSEKGLVVPIIKNVEKLGLHEIEIEISKYSKKIKDNALTPKDFQDGTFTISNGGVYGSLMSTPIINPPQSAILGMHSIVERPIAINSEVVIRPMMYVALSYDHRIIDGKEAVTFLKRIKEYVESPERMLLFV